MIEMFKDNEIRTSGLVYNSVFEQIKELYEYNPEQAGELAISAIELVLTGDISSDDVIVRMMLKPMQKINESNVAKYEMKVENQKQKKISEMKLDKIAEMLAAGYKQREIGERLGLSQQMVSYRINTIRMKYPELLQTDSTKIQTNSTNTLQKNKDTKDTNFVQICTNENVCTEESVCRPEEPVRKMTPEELKKAGFDF
jgi:predicted transcriptional regulator